MNINDYPLLKRAIMKETSSLLRSDKLKDLCKEYEEVFGSSLKDDYTEWANRLSSITGGKYLGEPEL